MFCYVNVVVSFTRYAFLWAHRRFVSGVVRELNRVCGASSGVEEEGTTGSAAGVAAVSSGVEEGGTVGGGATAYALGTIFKVCVQVTKNIIVTFL